MRMVGRLSGSEVEGTVYNVLKVGGMGKNSEETKLLKRGHVG